MTPEVDLQPRAAVDRCPGLLRPHHAEDGALVRLRLPGGRTDGATLRALSDLAVAFGSGSLQLTSRSNLQLRGIDEVRLPALVDEVSSLGLLPSATHERVRNVVASPFTGLVPSGGADLRPLVSALDRAVCAAPELADLPGRFLFALDDGRGDVLDRFDLAYRATGVATGTVLVGDLGHGFAVPLAGAVATLVDLAVGFVRLRATLASPPWHVRELPDTAALSPRIRALPAAPTTAPAPYGDVAGAAHVGVPLSLLEPHQVAGVDRAVGGGPVVVTPWRGLVLPAAAASLPALAGAGLVVADGSPWAGLSACVGAPGCAKSAISTRGLASALAAAGIAPDLRVHVSGCPRRCGAPAGDHVDLVAPRSLGQALVAVGGPR